MTVGHSGLHRFTRHLRQVRFIDWHLSSSVNVCIIVHELLRNVITCIGTTEMTLLHVEMCTVEIFMYF